MLDFDLTTTAGVTGLTLLIVAAIKALFLDQSARSYGLIVNICSVALAFGLSFAALLIAPKETWITALANGFIASLNATGIYEVIKNSRRVAKNITRGKNGRYH